jgi:hypothetical protein
VVLVVVSAARRRLSARCCISRVVGIPIFTLSAGDTFNGFRGTRTVSTGVVVVEVLAVESVRMVEESDIGVMELSDC